MSIIARSSLVKAVWRRASPKSTLTPGQGDCNGKPKLVEESRGQRQKCSPACSGEKTHMHRVTWPQGCSQGGEGKSGGSIPSLPGGVKHQGRQGLYDFGCRSPGLPPNQSSSFCSSGWTIKEENNKKTYPSAGVLYLLLVLLEAQQPGQLYLAR